LANWCGGTFVEDYGAKGAAVYHGGGEHHSWPDKGGVLILDCEKRLYAMRCLSSNPNHRGVAGHAGSPVNEWGCYADNDYPQSKHTYNALAPFPKEWGAGPMGGLVRIQSGGALVTPETDGKGTVTRVHGWTACYAFDLSQNTEGHRRLSGDAKYVMNGVVPSSINDSALSAADTKREGWWTTARSQSERKGMTFTHRSGTVTNFAAPGLSLVRWACLRYLADDDLLVCICDEPQFGAKRFGVVMLLELSKLPKTQWVTILPSVPNDPAMNWVSGNPAALEAGYCGPQWSSILRAFVAMDMKSPNDVSKTIRKWKLTPPQSGDRLTGQWTWSLETATSADGSTVNVRKDPGSVNGPFGKLVECPALRSLIWTRGPDARGQLIRLAGME
jgi:hypothetical protein